MEPTARMLANPPADQLSGVFPHEPVKPQPLAFVQIATGDDLAHDSHGNTEPTHTLYGVTGMGLVFWYDPRKGGWVRLPMTEAK